jgi:hypothetical protein
MPIHAAADLPGPSKALDQALRDFAALIERHLAPHEGAEVSFAIGETGTRANGLLARSVPDEVKGFDLSWTPSRRPLTAAQFREEIARNRPGKTSSQVRVDAEMAWHISTS